MSIRDLRNRARANLHSAMSVPAIYVAPGTGGAQTLCSVRVHARTQKFGDMAGFRFAPAERVEEVPQIVALADEVSPVRGGFYSISADEAYTVEVTMPRDGLTVTSQVTRMTAAEIAASALPVPGL